MSASFLAAVSARAADAPREHGAAAESSASLLLATNASLPKVDDIIPQLEVAAPVDISTLPPLDVMAAKLGAARDSAERIETLETLHNYPPEMLTAAVVDALLPCLSDGCVDVTHSAVGLLCPLGSAALAPHAPAILAHFEAAQDGVRWRVAEVLAALEPEALADQCGASVAALLAADSDDVRRRAVELLGSFPPAARAQHAPSALALLEDEDEDARLSAVEFFGKLDAATLDALPGLRDALVGRLDPSLEQEGCVRMTVVTVLAGLPHEPLLALVPRLVACLDDDFWRVRRAAMEALTNVPASALATESHLHAVLARLTHSECGSHCSSNTHEPLPRSTTCPAATRTLSPPSDAE